MSREIHGSTRFKNYQKPKVEERFDFAEMVRRQIERCLMVSIDEVAFSSAIMALETLIPEELKDEQYREESEESYQNQSVFLYDAPCGSRIGSETNPCMRDQSKPVLRLEDGSIDWDDPNIMSPQRVTEPVVNWYYRFESAFNMFVRLGIAVRRTNRG